MTTPRRRLIRPTHVPNIPPDRQRQLQRLRERLDKERAAQARWQSKLKRAFNAVEKSQRAVARLEKRINHLEG